MSDKKFPVYVAQCANRLDPDDVDSDWELIDETAYGARYYVAECLDKDRAQSLARATEVVNALGTDNAEMAKAYAEAFDAYEEVRDKYASMVAALGTDDVGQAEWLRDAVDDYETRLQRMFDALGTSDLAEMRRMRETCDWLKLVRDRGLVLREEGTSDERSRAEKPRSASGVNDANTCGRCGQGVCCCDEGEET